MTKGTVRDRVVEIKRILTKPRVMKEMDDYSFFSLGIQMQDGSYANISLSASDEDAFLDKAQQYLTINQETGEQIEVGGKYKIYEESTDEEEKYWNVKSFVKLDNTTHEGEGSVGASSLSTKDTTQQKIIRQSVLKAAAAAVPKDSVAQTVIEYAEKFEEWVNRK